MQKQKQQTTGMEKTLREIIFSSTINGRKSTFSLMDLLEALLLDEGHNNQKETSVTNRTRNGEGYTESEWDSLNKDIWVSSANKSV